MSVILAVKRYVSLRLARGLGLAQFEERLKALSEEVAFQARTLAEREAQLSETFGALDRRLEAIRELRAEAGRVNSRLIEFDRQFQRVDEALRSELRASAPAAEVEQLREDVGRVNARLSEFDGQFQRADDLLRSALDGSGHAIEQLRVEASRVNARLSEFDGQFERVDDALRSQLQRSDTAAAIEELRAEAGRVNARLTEFDRHFERLDKLLQTDLHQSEPAAAIEELRKEASRVNARLTEFDKHFQRLDQAFKTGSYESSRVNDRLLEFDKHFQRLENLVQFGLHQAGPPVEIEDLRLESGRINAKLAELDAAVRIGQVDPRPAEPAPACLAGSTRASVVAPLSFVCSHGRTATEWIFKALNLHPDIFAVHGPVSPPPADLNDPAYQNLLKTTWVSGERFHALTVDQMVEEMAVSDRPFKARVHAIGAFQLIEKMRSDRPRSPVRIVNVIRHPVTRAESFHRNFMFTSGLFREFRRHMTEFHQSSQIVSELVEVVHSNGFPKLKSNEDKLFINAVAWLANDFPDLTTGVPIFLHERLTSDSEYWTDFLLATFGPSVDIAFEYLRSVRELPPANAQNPSAPSSREVYAQWEPWKQFVFRHFALSRNLAAIYRPYGYRFP